MTRKFWPSTAENVVAVVDAVVAGSGATLELVTKFTGLPKEAAERALSLASDIGLVSIDGTRYSSASPLTRYLSTSNSTQQAAVLRVLLESYPPFVTFRERMGVGSVAVAAEQTRLLYDLDQHPTDVRDTLLSLGTFSQALVAKGPGSFLAPAMDQNPLLQLAEACTEHHSAEVRVGQQLGPTALANVSRDEVVIPLGEALMKSSGDPAGAVTTAGNAVESFLVRQAAALGVGLTGASGIATKVDRFLGAKAMPKAHGIVGKYLGAVRNAADHGVDADVGAAWDISPETGVEYVFVACSFIRGVSGHVNGEAPSL
jgi:hypothetical protein